MKTLHSVVLRCAVQYLLGYESGAYSGVVSSGIIWTEEKGCACKCLARNFPKHRLVAHVLEDEVPSSRRVQHLDPVHCARHRVDNRDAWSLVARQQRTRPDVVGPDPERVYCLFRIQLQRAICLLSEVERQLALEHGRERACGQVVRARRARLSEREEVEVPVFGGEDRPHYPAIGVSVLQGEGSR